MQAKQKDLPGNLKSSVNLDRGVARRVGFETDAKGRGYSHRHGANIGGTNPYSHRDGRNKKGKNPYSHRDGGNSREIIPYLHRHGANNREINPYLHRHGMFAGT
jgi:hypothetical protein